MNFERSIRNFTDYISDMGWRNERFAIEKIFNQSYIMKEKILDTLRKHPNFDEEMQGIVFHADFERKTDEYATNEFYYWVCNRIGEHAEENHISYYDYQHLKDIANILVYRTSQFATDEGYVDWINAICADNPSLGLQKFKVHVGQKRSRLVGKFCRMMGFDKHPEFQAEFAKYGDALNPLKIRRFTVISVNPNDFLRMSDGDGGWRSCHNPNKEAYSGCNCSGGISHALDSSSIIMYTVQPDYKGDLQRAEKVDRCVFFVDEGQTHFVQSKVYPDGTTQKSKEFREIFQMVWSQCTGQPNLWTKKSLGDECAYEIIGRGTGCTAYPDFEYCERNIIVHFYPSDADKSTFQKIYVGASPICVECGHTHSYEGEINCCHPWDTHICPNCGETWSDEDSIHYSSFHEETGCDDCMRYCFYLDDWFWDSDEFEWVRNLNESIPVCYMEYNDDFVRCSECGEWIYIGGWGDDFFYDEDGEYYCDRCFEEYFSCCEKCGEYFRTEDMKLIDGEYYCEYCAESIAEDKTA